MTERAIVHFDGDSFFASVEQALNHTLRGKPVVTGAERGAATSISYEAKRMGVSRSMTMRQIKEICPNVVVVNSDYRAYAMYAHRMYRIVRRFTPLVEEYSVDECFADITGLDTVYHKTYEEISLVIKDALEQALGITFGVGLAPTKVLAKAASKFNKPAGFTHISPTTKEEYLRKVPIGAVWGIGRSTTAVLEGLGITTAFDFACTSGEWLSLHGIAKPHCAIWHELNGTRVYELHVEPREDIGSIIKSRTFSPPSTNKAFVYSQLAKNVERACERARAAHIAPRAMSFYLKTQEFLYGRIELALPVATADPRELLRLIAPRFETLYKPRTEYRATGVSLHSMVPENLVTTDLFGEGSKVQNNAAVFTSLDKLNRRYGRQTVFVGSSMQAINYKEPSRVRKAGKRASDTLVSKAYKRKIFDLPFLGVAK